MSDDRNFSADEHTYPWDDLIPLATGEWELGDYLPDVLGQRPRGVRCNAAGTLVYRMRKSAADRTITVAAGEVIVGFFTEIKTGTDCEPAVGI